MQAWGGAEKHVQTIRINTLYPTDQVTRSGLAHVQSESKEFFLTEYKFIKSKYLEVGKVTQLVKSLPCMHEDLSSFPRAKAGNSGLSVIYHNIDAGESLGFTNQPI